MERRRALAAAMSGGPGPLLRYVGEWAGVEYEEDDDPGMDKFVDILTAAAAAWPVDGEPDPDLPGGALLLAVAAFARAMAVDILAEGSTP